MLSLIACAFLLALLADASEAMRSWSWLGVSIVIMLLLIVAYIDASGYRKVVKPDDPPELRREAEEKVTGIVYLFWAEFFLGLGAGLAVVLPMGWHMRALVVPFLFLGRFIVLAYALNLWIKLKTRWGGGKFWQKLSEWI